MLTSTSERMFARLKKLKKYLRKYRGKVNISYSNLMSLIYTWIVLVLLKLQLSTLHTNY